MGLLKKMMVGCDKAAFLVTKKEEGGLSFKESMQLKMHVMACKMCRHFEDRSEFINDKLADLMTSEIENSKMSQEKKSEIKEVLKDK